MAWPAVKKDFDQDGFREYVVGLRFGAWRPSLIVWHNTAAPSLAQWMKSAADDAKAGRTPGISRINALENYFKNGRGWPGAPHLFIAPDRIWVFNPLTAPGTHSPSWNNRSIGIEMIADFDREDDDSGDGLKVRNHTIFATAILCETFGLDPAHAIKLHREDPRTTHACPGQDFARDKTEAVAAVVALLSGGEHDDHEDIEAPPPAPKARTGLVLADDLSVRKGPGVTNKSVALLSKGDRVTILGEAKNGSTNWLKIRTPAGYEPFWVSGRYVKEG